MVVIDTSAWIEFLNDTGHEIVSVLEYVLRPGLFNPAFLRRALDYVTPLT